jgi:hypothetical protein
VAWLEIALQDDAEGPSAGRAGGAPQDASQENLQPSPPRAERAAPVQAGAVLQPSFSDRLNAVADEGYPVSIESRVLKKRYQCQKDFERMFVQKEYNYANPNSLKLLGSPQNGYGGGQLIAFMSAKTTQDTIVWLLRNAHPWEPIMIAFYTYDLVVISEAILAARQSGNDITVCGDYRTCLGASTRDQLNRVIALKAAGVAVYLVAGLDIQPEYALVGKSVRPGIGILHQKTALIGNWLVCGSTNFTTSSRTNRELSVLLWLDDATVRQYHELYKELAATGELLTNELIAKAEIEQENRRLRKQREKERRATSSRSSASK